eukprot:symbB.v1.2.035983.t1/scaffold4972.1/size33872/3
MDPTTKRCVAWCRHYRSPIQKEQLSMQKGCRFNLLITLMQRSLRHNQYQRLEQCALTALQGQILNTWSISCRGFLNADETESKRLMERSQSQKRSAGERFDIPKASILRILDLLQTQRGEMALIPGYIFDTVNLTSRRWLPKRERSEFKKKMRKRDKHLLRGPQGAITTEDFRKQGPSTAQVEAGRHPK